MSRLLVDLTDTPCGCTNHALDELHKAIADGGAGDIWEPHQDPLIAGHIESVTSRGIAILATIRDVISGRLALQKAAWVRRDPVVLAEVKAKLDAKPRALYTYQDWVALIDWALETYLGPEVVYTEAEYLAVRATFLGALQASFGTVLSDEDLAKLAGVAPKTLVAAGSVLELTGRRAAVLQFAELRAADLIVDLGEQTRKRMRAIILRHEERKALGEPLTTGELESALFDEFDFLNRDWRRIAVTEAGRNANEGFIASLPVGAKVKRLEVYESACAFCKRIHGMTFTVVDPEKEDKDGWTEVWPGKSNVGRSASPRKRVGNELVERMPEELWWPAAGVQHPHCRGRWVHVTEPPRADRSFEDWVADKLKTARAPVA